MSASDPIGAASSSRAKDALCYRVVVVLKYRGRVAMNRSLVLCTAASGTSIVVDSSSGATVMNYFSSEDAVLRSSCVAQTALGFVLQHSNKPHMHLYNWAKKQPTTRCAAPEPIHCICSDASNCFVFAGAASGKGYVWNSSTGDLLVQWNAHFRGVSCVAATHDAAFVVTGGDDGLVQVWSVASLCSGGVAPFCSFAAHAMPVTALAISAGGGHGLVATAGADRNVQICSIASKSVLGSCMMKSAGTCLAWLPFMNMLYIGCADGMVVPLSLATTPLQPSIETFGPHRGAVTAVVVTPDASRLVTGGVDCTLVVWSIRTRTSLHIVAVREPVVALLPLLLAPVFAATSQLPQPSAFKKSVTPVSQLAVQLPALCGVDTLRLDTLRAAVTDSACAHEASGSATDQVPQEQWRALATELYKTCAAQLPIMTREQ